jgi:iron complex outermembrane receptor protein
MRTNPLLRAPPPPRRLVLRPVWLPGLLVALLLATAAPAQDEIPTGEAAPAEGEAPVGEPAPEEIPPDEWEEDEGAAEGLGAISIPKPPSEGVEEIVITGELLEGVVEDKTVSVIGFDQNVLKLEGIKDIRDLSNFTPTLEIKSAFAASNPTIFIRGVGLDDFNANAASAVAIYQDGVYMQSPVGQLFQFFDTESVQVLRGPQPSLYRSASAGAILVESRKPGDELDAYVTATYGNYNLVEVEGAVGGPIVPGLLSGRLSGSWGIRDGITENRCAPTSSKPRGQGQGIPLQCANPPNDNAPRFVEPGVDPWTNDIDAYAARGQLLFKQPVGESEMEWLVNLHGGQNMSKALQFQHQGVKFLPFCSGTVVPPDCVTDVTENVPLPLVPGEKDASNYGDEDGGDPFAGDYDFDGPEDISLMGFSLRGDWLFGDGYQLRSLTAYEWHDRYTLENSDANPNFLLKDEYTDTSWQVSQQFDLRGNWAESDTGSGTWVLGTYYLQEDLGVTNFFDVQAGQKLNQEYTQNTRNFAAYAQSEYNILPGCAPVPCDFTLVTGLRYNLEFKEFDILVDNRGGTALSGADDDSWSGLGAEVSLAWNFQEVSSLYAKYSRGWKGGHFNGGAITQFDVVSGVDPEIVDSYEGGLRSFWFDDRLMLNLTGFYYDYQDLQVFQLEQTDGGFPIAKLVNANDAIVYGIELDLGASPLAGLNLTYNFAWVESEYVDFKVTLPDKFRPDRQAGQVQRPPTIVRKTYDYSGNPLIASPRFSMTGSVEYAVPLPGTLGGRGLGTLTPRFSFSWKDDIFFDACGGKGARCNFPEATFGQPAFWVLNSALTWRSEDERYELTGWVHNFLDEHYKTQNFDLSNEFRLILEAYAEPRTFGITATVSF